MTNTNRKRTPKPLADRLWPKLDKQGDDGCWLFQGSKIGRGYGKIYLDHRRAVPAHRVAWELTHGSIPAGMFACHRCDNPPCCNPAHLFLGTAGDNNADRCAKGRTRTGKTGPLVPRPPRLPSPGPGRYRRVTKAETEDVLRLYRLGHGATAIGRLVGLHVRTIRDRLKALRRAGRLPAVAAISTAPKTTNAEVAALRATGMSVPAIAERLGMARSSIISRLNRM